MTDARTPYISSPDLTVELRGPVLWLTIAREVLNA